MAQVFAVLQNNPAQLRCLLHVLEPAVDLQLGPGKALGIGYFENGKVLLRKRPAGTGAGLEAAASDVQSEVFVASAQEVPGPGFREEDIQPYRFRAWLFAGAGRILPPGEQAKVLEALPDFLRRGRSGTADAELAFLATLGHIHTQSRQLDLLDLAPDVAATALRQTLAQVAHAAPAEACAFISNGRMVAAMRRGRPLSYALVEGISECEVCGLGGGASDNDPRVLPHRRVRAVVLASAPKKGVVPWMDVPENHLLTVSRGLDVRLQPL